MDKYNFFKQGGLRPTAEQLLDTELFFQNSVEVYNRFEDWKDNDNFYFIPIFLQMTYSCAGWVAEIATDPVWLGSFVRCTKEHPELFQYQCPECGMTVFPYRYCGSPLSGRVDLEGRCECGWKGFEMVSGWRIRATTLRDQICDDSPRSIKLNLVHPVAKQATIEGLLAWLRQ